jgi:hypothetical protein
MTEAHTPWTIGLDGENVCTIYSGRSGIATVFGLPMHTRTDWEGLSHARWVDGMEVARLIAAAPCLLEAAVEFVRKVDAGEARSTKSYAAFKAAILKATTPNAGEKG